MQFHMQVETVCIRKGFPTGRAEVGSLSCVDSHVFPQCAGALEAGATLGAGEGFFSCVDLLVPFELTSAYIPFLTLVTAIRSLA